MVYRNFRLDDELLRQLAARATTIQSWWRGIVGKRNARFALFSKSQAVTGITAARRGMLVRRWYSQVHDKRMLASARIQGMKRRNTTRSKVNVLREKERSRLSGLMTGLVRSYNTQRGYDLVRQNMTDSVNHIHRIWLGYLARKRVRKKIEDIKREKTERAQFEARMQAEAKAQEAARKAQAIKEAVIILNLFTFVLKNRAPVPSMVKRR